MHTELSGMNSNIVESFLGCNAMRAQYRWIKLSVLTERRIFEALLVPCVSNGISLLFYFSFVLLTGPIKFS